MAEERRPKSLTRVRPPDVRVSYDLAVGDAIEWDQLPFTTESLDGLANNPAEPIGRLKHRGFLDVNIDNFESVVKKFRKASEAPDASPEMKEDSPE